jgi:hypothetical protein
MARRSGCAFAAVENRSKKQIPNRVLLIITEENAIHFAASLQG